MDFFEEYDSQIRIDYIVWRSLPTIFGYWAFLAVAIFLWHFRLIAFDRSITSGLEVGIAVWVLAHVVLGWFGSDLIITNLWVNYGCGCLAKLIAIPLSPYFGILGILFWAYRVGDLGIFEFATGLVLGWVNWLVLSYLDTY